MNAEEDSRRGQQRQAIQQLTITLSYFDEEVPVLYPSSHILYSSHYALRDAGITQVMWNVDCLLVNKGGPRPLCTCCQKGFYDILTK